MKDINNSKKIIFVEGDDDFHFLCNLLEIQGITDVFVEKINGKSKLKQALRAFKNIDSSEIQYVFDGSFFADKTIKIEFDNEKAFLAFEDAFCGRRAHLLNQIEIHRVLQIKKFESKDAAEDFESRVRSSKKCRQVAEYYSESTIEMFDYFKE